MKIVKNLHKAWSMWGLGVLAMLQFLLASWPDLQGTIDPKVHAFGMAALLIGVMVLRAVDQGFKSAVDEESLE